MRKLMFASVFILASPVLAMAGGNHSGVSGNLAGTGSLSNSGVSASQGTQAGAVTIGNGFSYQSATAGNAASVTTQGYAKSGPKGTVTGSTTSQQQAGNASVMSVTHSGWGGFAGGGGAAGQNSAVTGNTVAAGADLNGYFTVKNH
jgi:hypothetical protein